MGFARGPLTIVAGDQARFNGYKLYGAELEDVRGKRGWIVQLLGPETGFFAVIDDEVCRAKIDFKGRDVVNPLKIEEGPLDVEETAMRAIFRAIIKSKDRAAKNRCAP